MQHARVSSLSYSSLYDDVDRHVCSGLRIGVCVDVGVGMYYKKATNCSLPMRKRDGDQSIMT